MKKENVNQSQTQFEEMFKRLSFMSGEKDTAVLHREAESIGADISQLRFEMNKPNQALPNGKWTVISDFSAIVEFRQANNIDPFSLSYGLNQDGRVHSIISSFNTIVSAEGLHGLPYLSALTLQGSVPLECAHLGALSKLKSLNLNDSKPTNFEFLSGLKNLQGFHALRTGFCDLSLITGLHSLESLSFGQNGITDISALTKLKNLRFLSISSENIRDLSPLAQLPELTTLELLSLPPQDLNILHSIPKLRHVYLSGDIRVFDNQRCFEALRGVGIVVELF